MRPDYWSDIEGNLQEFDKMSDDYKKVTAIWVGFNAYFAGYLLK